MFLKLTATLQGRYFNSKFVDEETSRERLGNLTMPCEWQPRLSLLQRWRQNLSVWAKKIMKIEDAKKMANPELKKT